MPQRISYIHLCLRFQIIINGHIEIQQQLIRGFPVSDHIPESPGFCLSHIIPRHMHIAAFTVGHTRRAVYHRKQVVSLIPDRSDLVKTIGHADFSACFRGGGPHPVNAVFVMDAFPIHNSTIVKNSGVVKMDFLNLSMRFGLTWHNISAACLS